MLISVIIPVYNAVRYVEAAVQSAHELPQVGELILIDDASPDGGWEMCQHLATKYPKVVAYQHEGGANKGAGPSRNLGIEKSRHAVVAFLDADDLYLPNRFEADVLKLQDPAVDGVYNCAAYLMDSDYARERTKSRYKTDDPAGYRYTIRDAAITQQDLFYYVLNGGKGHFHTSAITVRKSLFEKTGNFSDLRLHQDSHMWVRLALKGNLVAGNIAEPVSLIRVHEQNRIRTLTRNTKADYYHRLYTELKAEVKPGRDYAVLVKKRIAAQSRISKSRAKNLPLQIKYFILHFLKYPADLAKVSVKHLF